MVIGFPDAQINLNLVGGLLRFIEFQNLYEIIFDLMFLLISAYLSQKRFFLGKYISAPVMRELYGPK